MSGLATEAHARRLDPDTSHDAAAAISAHLPHKQMQVLRYAARVGEAGFTDLAMQENFSNHSSTYRTRRAELVDAGFIEDSGHRQQPGGKGRLYIVWRITDAGRAAAERIDS
jgi:DNA-binding MarR family transcriptional regulator